MSYLYRVYVKIKKVTLMKINLKEFEKFKNLDLEAIDELDEKTRLKALYVKCYCHRDLVIDEDYKNYKIKRKAVYAFFKRFFDIFCSLLGLIILSPVFLIIALGIKITDGGPVFYRSIRIKKDGKPFVFYKFRSMYVNADKDKKKLKKENEIKDGPTFKCEHDFRITKFGNFLRKTSLDELPQLLNILKGEMTIVGPRPCTHDEFLTYQNYDNVKYRLKVKQGLTGMWQVNGRSDTDFKTMINYDLDYINKKRGFFYDIYLIIKTVFVVILSRGAK